MATSEVILTQKIANLGAEADVVKVKRGYARNFLIPQGKALELNPAALKRRNQLLKRRAEREATELNESQELSRRIAKLNITMELETGETGKSFGSITANDVALRLKSELGFEIDRHKIHLERPIKESGEHEVTVKLHHEITAKLRINVRAKGSVEAVAEAVKSEKGESDEAKQEGFKAKPKAKHKG